MRYNNIKPLFTSYLDLIWTHLESGELDRLSDSFYVFCDDMDISIDNEIASGIFLNFACNVLENNIEGRKKVENILIELRKEYFAAENKNEQGKIVFKYYKGLYERAFLSKKRLFKTLDFEGVAEAYSNRINAYTKNNTTIFRLLSGIILKNKTIECSAEILEQYQQLALAELKENIPDITKKEILSTISLMIKSNKYFIRIAGQAFNDEIHSLRKTTANTWVICSCIEIILLFEQNRAYSEINKYLNIEFCDDIFIREFCVRYSIQNKKSFTDWEFSSLLKIVSVDSSPFVRQALASNLNLLSDNDFELYFKILLEEDKETSVRCAVLKNAKISFRSSERKKVILKTIKNILENEINVDILKYTLNTLIGFCLTDIKLDNDLSWVSVFIEYIENLRINENIELSTKRFAATVKEQLWCFSSDNAFELYEKISAKINEEYKNKEVKFLAAELDKYTSETIGRVLSVIAQKNYSLDLKKGISSYKLIIKPIFCFRWWRFLYELRNPSPEKRQTVKHTTGRLFKGTIRASSGIMAEQSETKVPGEPLLIDREGDARPYLPLVDEFISAAEYGKQVQSFSSEGITTITPPKGWIKRFISDLKLTFKYKKLAKLRNWQPGVSEPPSAYIEQIRKLGFKVSLVSFKDSKNNNLNPEVSKFFLPAIMPFGLVQFINRLKIYFLSLYDNTVYQLTVFICLFILFITGRHYFLNLMIKRARNSIPLVIGGWGTRGKSGTERIKAALFSALGCTVVSKTTGCEAMFLYTPNFGKTHELFLFRPYDKATIWEQFNLIRTASKLRADVFLWECMALSPPYVKVLQKDWMRDDYSTITNTYPDHEDLQGPAGWNIAETMTNFIPEKSVLFTTEEQMYPILDIGARLKNTEFFTVNKFDTMLLSPDILERFPYEEHPYNIELVLKMAEYLGISRQFALKEMADNVVPDIGVLKRYEPGIINNRKIEFYSGMSANERFGCMGNWTRMKFDKYDLENNPDVYIATVVNNRADRIARSKVFAKILVEDLSADKHFLIGNNLEGFMGYIKEAWNNKISDFTLSPKNSEIKRTPREIFIDYAKQLRMPLNKEQLKKILSVLTNNCELSENWDNADCLAKFSDGTLSDEVLKFYKEYLQIFGKYNTLIDKIEKSGHQSLDDECRKFFWGYFKTKFVIVENYFASGNEVLKTISDSVPPNFNIKLMALQNIKGTGLDFFYRWQAWENFAGLCNLLNPDDDKSIEGILTEILSCNDFDILWIDRLNKLIELLKNNNGLPDNIQALLENIESKLKNTKFETKKASKQTNHGKLYNYCINTLENFLDPADAVRRRKKSDKIYKDLINERISCSNAIKELHRLTKRQKGGWLKSKK